MLNKPFLTVCLALALAFLVHPAFADDVLGIPLKPDPPFAIDGDLNDWTMVWLRVRPTRQGSRGPLRGSTPTSVS